jgi:transposase
VRGKFDPQAVLFTAAVDLEGRVRADHPLRAVKRMVDEDLRKMSRRFDAAYAGEGRPSVPPERLIKAMLLQAIYSIRSEAQLVERIDYDLLFRWFLDMRLDEPMFDATVFCHNRQRLERHDLIGGFFDTTVRRAIAAGLVSARITSRWTAR